MIAVKSKEFRNHMKKYCDMITNNNEIIILTRNHDKNIILVTQNHYNNIRNKFNDTMIAE